MRKKVTPTGVTLWLSADDTYNWAAGKNKGRAWWGGAGSWPCSTLSGRRLRAEFDSNGLLDLTVDGRYSDCETGLYSGRWVDGWEFSAMAADFLKPTLDQSHPCYFVAVGQFE